MLTKSVFDFRVLMVLGAFIAAMPGVSLGTYIGAGGGDVPDCNTKFIQASTCKGNNCSGNVQTPFGCPEHGGGGKTIVAKNAGSACQGSPLYCTPNQFNVIDGGTCVVQSCPE